MIVYQENIKTFVQSCFAGNIATIIDAAVKRAHIGGGSPSEFNSWASSLPHLGNVLSASGIDENIDVAVEYKIQTNMERVDFIIYGKNENDDESVVVVELKQWSRVQKSNLGDHVYTHVGGVDDDHWHPSCQAFNYATSIRSFNEYAYTSKVGFQACSFLHNLDFQGGLLLKNQIDFPVVKEAPVFIKGDEAKLAEFIKKYVKKPYKNTLYEIDNSRIRPSQEFANMLDNAIKGNPFFTYDESQAYCVSKIVAEVRDSYKTNKRKTIIIKGGPGTGKSVVAVNVLGQLLHPSDGFDKLNAVYTTFTFTPRQYNTDVLVGKDYTKRAIGELFKKPSVFTRTPTLDFDCVIVDEAHRAFEWKFGYQVKRDVDMIESIFKASRVNVFFIDEDQTVTTTDGLNVAKIKHYADKYHSEIIDGTNLTLTAQYRCLGGDEYIRFINYVLGYTNTFTSIANQKYVFKVVDKPEDLVAMISSKNSGESKDSRLLAGNTKIWVSREDPSKYDFVYPNCSLKWNSIRTDMCAIRDEQQLDRVFMVHTVQGLDLEYAGVIIGKDLRYDPTNKKIIFDKTKLAQDDTSGARTTYDANAAKLIRNTYKVLLTRGLKGTFVYCEDDNLRDYLKALMAM